MAHSFFCSDCGFESAKWSGKCPSCGSWGTLKESKTVLGKKGATSRRSTHQSKPERIIDIQTEGIARLATGITELDLVLGGGIVSGMLTLIGGEPGIGKSTLMLQLSQWLGSVEKKVLYVSGEESDQQIRLRATRLDVHSPNIWLYCTTDVDAIIDVIQQTNPDCVIIDSIQSVHIPSLDSIPGSVTQLRESCSRLARIGKTLNTPIFMVGHVTKEGLVAGPKIIEHIVDTVLYFEGESRGQYKILRAVKNRFGSTNELGIFEMTSTGLKEVSDPNHIFLSRDFAPHGTSIGCVMEGTRSFIVEVQTLATGSSYGTPQRVAVGLEQKKLAMLLAILEKNLALYLRNSDVFINLAGGMRSGDTALDLPILAALISSLKDSPLPEKSVFIGEVGLNGEIRPVSQSEARVKEALKLGYTSIYLAADSKLRSRKGVHKVKHIKDVYSLFG